MARMKRVGVVAGAVLSMGLVASCANAVEQGEVEDTVASSLEDADMTVNSVECPEGLAAEEGTTMTCDVDVEDAPFSQVRLEVYEVVDNEVRYNIDIIEE